MTEAEKTALVEKIAKILTDSGQFDVVDVVEGDVLVSTGDFDLALVIETV